MGKVIQFPTGQADNDSVAEPDEAPRPAHVDRTPDPGGLRERGHTAVVALRHTGARLARRTVWEMFAGAPRRGLRLLRWFARGVVGHRDDTGSWVGGWLGLLLWCFAARERRDAHLQAAEHPGAELRGTQQADQIAIWHSVALIVPHLIGALAIEYWWPGYWWLVFGPLVVGTIIYGHHIDPKPPEHIDAPSIRGDITRDALEEALRAVGTLAKPTTSNPKPDTIRFARPPRMVGDGQEVVVDLPASVKDSAADVVRKREKIAASLAVPLAQLHLEPGDHAGRVAIWYATRDPFAGEPLEHPLLDATTWSVFDRIPVGTDARRRRISVPMVDTNFLIGGLPGSGKSSWARSIASAMVLDPLADLYVFDGKQGKDWAALEPVSEVFEAGRIPDQAARLRELLEWFLSDGDDRFHRLRQYPDDMCPDSRITRALAEDGMRFRFLILDEAHRYLADPKHGETITRLLIDYVKGYRETGFGLMFITQSTSGALAERFTSLREVIGTRIACRVMDWRASNMILGEQMNTLGWDASEILEGQAGTAVVRADIEADVGQSRRARMVRSYYMDRPTWRAVCEQGLAVRQAADRGAAVAVDDSPDELLTATELLARFRLFGPESLPDVVRDAQGLGEWLSSRGVRSQRNSAGQRVRSRVSVEAAVGVSRGALKPSDGHPVDTSLTPAVAPVDGRADTLVED